MDLEILIGIPIDPSELNVTCLVGYWIESMRVFAKDLSELAMNVRFTFSFSENYVLHSNTTSHLLYGE
jgi:hypothetical protein